MSGSFVVPSYRTGLFLDPKGRGTTTGYDQAVALPALQAGGDEALFKENNKKFDVGSGTIEMKVTAVNGELGEFGGVFVQKQPSDTDLGSKVPKEVLLKGQFFGTVQLRTLGPFLGPVTSLYRLWDALPTSVDVGHIVLFLPGSALVRLPDSEGTHCASICGAECLECCGADQGGLRAFVDVLTIACS
eukprot:scaffold35163_cov30-Tisochrysis_lutea.AAC.1